MSYGLKPKIFNLPLHVDDRGSVHCVLDRAGDDGWDIKRIYIVENFSMGMIRAWHGHRNHDTIVHVIQGAAKLAAVEIDDDCPVVKDVPIGKEKMSCVLDVRKPAFFYVPAGWFNGAMSLVDGTKLLVCSTGTFDEVQRDDVRVDYRHYGEFWKVKHR